MELKLYQINAFAARSFEGNPAAVVPLDEWLSDSQMQAIAEQNNLSETVFFVPSEDGYHIRWFTPLVEVSLCGHATLASAYVLFEILDHPTEVIHFDSLSGPLSVTREGAWLKLDCPAQLPQPCETPQDLLQALRHEPVACLTAEDYIVVMPSEAHVAAAEPDMALLSQLDRRGVAITAQGDHHDFVCRFFAPKYGIPEDPVTGSSFTQLAPYWATRLGKQTLHARQISSRTGEVRCQVLGQRVHIAGQANKYLEGVITL